MLSRGALFRRKKKKGQKKTGDIEIYRKSVMKTLFRIEASPIVTYGSHDQFASNEDSALYLFFNTNDQVQQIYQPFWIDAYNEGQK